MDAVIIRHRLLMAQYGDLTYGHDARKLERRERQWRKKIAVGSRGPMHAGFNWEAYD